jgi:hypothetical protein
MRLSRRTFLRALGVSAAASPFVPLLSAEAEGQPFPTRLILFYTPHGTLLDAWKPTGTGSAFTLGPILAPLKRHQAKLTVISGLSMPNVGVGAPHTKGLPLLWTGSKLLEDDTFTRPDGSGGDHFGWNSGPSVDQFLVKKLAPPTSFRSLEFGVRSGGNHPASRMIYRDAQQPVEPATDPALIFQRLFVGRSEQSIRERQSAIDLVKAELTGLKPRLPSADRPKLEAHLGALRSIETRLQVRASACTGPALGAAVDARRNENTPAVFAQHQQLLTSALTCDLSRFASIQYTVGDNDDATYPWLGISDTGHHTLTHAPASDAHARKKLIQIYTWYAEQLAGLLDLLDAVPEGDGTLLDHSLVVWGSELSTGNTHSFASMPFVVAGGANGAIQTGRHLDTGNTLTHHRLLVSICHAFGARDVTTFGNTDARTGPLASLLR